MLRKRVSSELFWEERELDGPPPCSETAGRQLECGRDKRRPDQDLGGSKERGEKEGVRGDPDGGCRGGAGRDTGRCGRG